MAPHSSILAWKIPWIEEPGGLQSMGLLRVGHDWATSLSLSCIGERNGNLLQYSFLENPRDDGAWWAAVSGVAQSRTQLKRPSTSSSSSLSFKLTCNPALSNFIAPANVVTCHYLHSLLLGRLKTFDISLMFYSSTIIYFNLLFQLYWDISSV